MFFSIARQPDSQFPNQTQMGSWWFNCDNGWHRDGSVFYKGYADHVCMRDLVQNLSQCNTQSGNFCAVEFDQQVRVHHNRNRTFELWHDSHTVTNLPPPRGRYNVWADHQAVCNHGGVTLEPIDTDSRPSTGTLTWDQALTQIMQRLGQQTRAFFSTNQPHMRLYLSGGIDTLMLYSLLTRLNLPFELVPYTYYAQDYFVTRNERNLSYFWNYSQIHHWLEPAWLATGSHGDEYFLRGPETIAMLTSWHDIDFLNLLHQHPDSYHSVYFGKHHEIFAEAWQRRHEFRDRFPDQQDLHGHVLNFLLNDYQYYHLGNTLTWTPFRDIDILKTMLQIPIEQLLPQFLNAQFSRDLVANTDPDLLGALSRYKNHNSSENVMHILARHTS